MGMVTIVSCQKFDASDIWDKLNDHESRIAYLEEVCKNMNTNIVNLQAIVTALETNDYIISASPLVTGDGYTFLFRSGKSVVIYNGKDGQNGTNGIDGVTPVISVKQDADGCYYWTVNGEWLVVDGKKIKASATDGQNGTNGVTPQFKIEEDYWFISYDNGANWERLGKASGSNGLNGTNGDSFFKGVYMESSCVHFILNDGKDTIISIPFYSPTELTIDNNIAGELRTRITSEQKRELLSMTITGVISEDDMKFINSQMLALENLDMRGCVVQPNFELNPYQDLLINRTIRTFKAPRIKPTAEALHKLNVSYATNLEKLTIAQDSIRIYTTTTPWVIYPVMSPNLETLEYDEGVKYVSASAGYFKTVIIPKTVERIYYELLWASDVKQLSDIYCYAMTPPIVGYSESATKWVERKFCDPVTEFTIHVPEESLDLYKSAIGWGEYADKIVPIR